MMVAVVESGVVTARLVDPPPSRHSTVWQPSSRSRLPTCVMDAPMEWPLRRPSTV